MKMRDISNRPIIGFDAKRIVNNNTGLGNYGRTLINSLSLANSKFKFNLYSPDKGKDILREQVANVPNIEFCYPTHTYLRIQKDWWRQRGIVKRLLKDNVTLYHGLSGELPQGIKKHGIKSVVTIHDLIFLRHPEYYTPIDTYIYKRKFLSTCKEADLIIAISECTKKDILSFSDYPEDKIKVIYQSCGLKFKETVDFYRKDLLKRKYNLPNRFILYVGSIEERKNLLLPVKALEYLPQDISLVAVGKQTTYTLKVEKYIKSKNLTNRVKFLYNITTEELPAIYQQAECFVYPSRYEGFGIPIVEAIQSGLPVVACKGSCLEEAGGESCLYVDPDDVISMANAISSLLIGSENRNECIENSQKYIKRFENNDVAHQVLEVYDKILSITTRL